MTDLDPVDRLILTELGEMGENVLVVDSPGLASCLDRPGVSGWCDDWSEHHRLPDELALDPFEVLAGISQPAIDVGLYRLPKSLGELDEVAGIVARSGGWLLAGARIKHLNYSMNSVIGRHFDAVNASRGVSKSRVLRGIGPNPLENEWPKRRHHPDLELWVASHGGTFGGTKIDPGTRLLISHLDQVEGESVIDLGCGNGTLAALLARAGRNVRATDSSVAAVAATRETAALNDLAIETSWADGLAAMADGTADAIVCNPPFHQDRAKESSPTLAMFADARRVLIRGGEFWCVYNSHLPWRHELNQLVGPTKVIAQNPGYTLTRSTAR